jgi:hypothetical protein
MNADGEDEESTRSYYLLLSTLILSAFICVHLWFHSLYLVPASRLRSLSVILLDARPARPSHFGEADADAEHLRLQHRQPSFPVRHDRRDAEFFRSLQISEAACYLNF